MLNEKLIAILANPVDCAVSVATCSEEGPHIANTWNSYIEVTPQDKLLIPVAGFLKTEKNLAAHNEAFLSIASREVEGYHGKGTGFNIKATTCFLKSGEDFDRMKRKFPWLRATLEVTIISAKQTL